MAEASHTSVRYGGYVSECEYAEIWQFNHFSGGFIRDLSDKDVELFEGYAFGDDDSVTIVCVFAEYVEFFQIGVQRKVVREMYVPVC